MWSFVSLNSKTRRCQCKVIKADLPPVALLPRIYPLLNAGRILVLKVSCGESLGGTACGFNILCCDNWWLGALGVGWLQYLIWWFIKWIFLPLSLQTAEHIVIFCPLSLSEIRVSTAEHRD